MLRPQKGNSGVSFNDTLSNFGLWCTVQTHPVSVQCIVWTHLAVLPVPFPLLRGLSLDNDAIFESFIHFLSDLYTTFKPSKQ